MPTGWRPSAGNFTLIEKASSRRPGISNDGSQTNASQWKECQMDNLKDLLSRLNPQTVAVAERDSNTLCNRSSELMERERATRELKLSLLIQDSRVVRDLPSQEIDDLKAKVNAWSRVLHELTADEIAEAYQRAIRDHQASEKPEPFAVAQILRAHREIQQQRRRQNERLEYQRYMARAAAKAERVSFDELLEMLEDARQKHLELDAPEIRELPAHEDGLLMAVG